MQGILIVVVILWFLATEVGKVTSSVNSANATASKLAGPLGALGGAGANLVNAGASAIGKFGGTGNQGGTPTTATSTYSYGGVTYTTSGGAGTVDSGPFAPGVTPQTTPFRDVSQPYAPGATAPGPFAPNYGGGTSSAMSDDLMTPDFADV